MAKKEKRSHRLLVVDDEPDIGDFIREVAEEKGFEVKVTHNGREFLEAYKTFEPTVICLDVIMPDVDGIEILQELAAINCTQPILVISGYNELYLQSAQNLGSAFGLPRIRALQKPLSLKTLRSALEEAA